MKMPPVNRFFAALCATALLSGASARAQQLAPTPRDQALDFIRNETQFHLGISTAWRLGLGSLRFIGPESMRETNVTCTADAVTGTWKGHAECGDAFTVTVTWRRAPDSLWSGELAYDGHSGKLFVEEIRFPILSGAFTEDTSFVFGGHDSGVVCSGAAFFKPGARHRRNYGNGMQCSALINSNGQSFYVDHRDPTSSLKSCDLYIAKEGERITYEGIHVVGLQEQPPAAYRIPYASSFMPFTGGWFEAGQIYKKWGGAQTWHTNRKGVNPLRKIGMWVWNRGLVKGALPPVERLFDGQMLSPAGFTCATAPVDYLIRSIFTKEHECKPRHAEVPAVLHSAWQAPDGRKALILVNWTRSEQPWTFNGLAGTLPPRSYGKTLLREDPPCHTPTVMKENKR